MAGYRFLFMVVLAVTSAGQGYAQSYRPIPCGGINGYEEQSRWHEYQNYPHQDCCDPCYLPFVWTADDSPANQIDPDNAAEKSNEPSFKEWRTFADKLLKADTDAIIALFTSLTFAAITIQALIFVWQLCVMRRTLKIAEASVSTLEIPFIVVTDIKAEMTQDGSFGRITDIIYKFYNYGRTPAILLGEFRDFIIVPKGSEPKPIRKKIAATDQFPYGIIVRDGGERSHHYPNFIEKISEDQWQAIKEGKERLFFLGWIKYADRFRKRYKLGFCAVYNPASKRFDLTGGEDLNYNKKER